MERFDEMLKNMAGKEACIVPEGVDRRMEKVLEGLPPQGKRRRLGAVKGALIAAAACLALAGTAFAASPGLRDLLAEALGSFAPYAQEQDSAAYAWNGFELKVLSAMADENTLRVYVQLKDMEKRDRVNIHGDTWLSECPMLSIGGLKSSVDITGSCAHTSFEHNDPEAQTVVAVVTFYGRMTEDLTGAELWADPPRNMMDQPQSAAVKIPLDIEMLPSRTLLRFEDTILAGARAEELRMSPLGLTLITGRLSYATTTRLDLTFRVQLKDGSQVDTEQEGASGHGTYRTIDGAHHLAQIWNFRQPVELDQVAGVYIGEDYFPIE